VQRNVPIHAITKKMLMHAGNPPNLSAAWVFYQHLLLLVDP
jgi:hypothetical protein